VSFIEKLEAVFPQLPIIDESCPPGIFDEDLLRASIAEALTVALAEFTNPLML